MRLKQGTEGMRLFWAGSQNGDWPGNATRAHTELGVLFERHLDERVKELWKSKPTAGRGGLRPVAGTSGTGAPFADLLAPDEDDIDVPGGELVAQEPRTLSRKLCKVRSVCERGQGRQRKG